MHHVEADTKSTSHHFKSFFSGTSDWIRMRNKPTGAKTKGAVAIVRLTRFIVVADALGARYVWTFPGAGLAALHTGWIATVAAGTAGR